MLKFYFVVFLSQLGDKNSATPKRLSLSKHMFYSGFNVCKTCTIWINAIPRRKLKGKEELPSERIIKYRKWYLLKVLLCARNPERSMTHESAFF